MYFDGFFFYLSVVPIKRISCLHFSNRIFHFHMSSTADMMYCLPYCSISTIYCLKSYCSFFTAFFCCCKCFEFFIDRWWVWGIKVAHLLEGAIDSNEGVGFHLLLKTIILASHSTILILHDPFARDSHDNRCQCSGTCRTIFFPNRTVFLRIKKIQ